MTSNSKLPEYTYEWPIVEVESSPLLPMQLNLFRDLRTSSNPQVRALQPRICLQCWMVFSVEDQQSHKGHNQTSDFAQMEEASRATFLALCKQYDRLTPDGKQVILMKVQAKVTETVEFQSQGGANSNKAKLKSPKKPAIQEVDLTDPIKLNQSKKVSSSTIGKKRPLAIDDQADENYLSNSMMPNMGNMGVSGQMMDQNMMNQMMMGWFSQCMMGMNGGSSGPQTKNSAKRQKVSDMNPFSGLETRLVKMEKILDTLSTNSTQGMRLLKENQIKTNNELRKIMKKLELPEPYSMDNEKVKPSENLVSIANSLGINISSNDPAPTFNGEQGKELVEKARGLLEGQQPEIINLDDNPEVDEQVNNLQVENNLQNPNESEFGANKPEQENLEEQRDSQKNLEAQSNSQQILEQNKPEQNQEMNAPEENQEQDKPQENLEQNKPEANIEQDNLIENPEQIEAQESLQENQAQEQKMACDSLQPMEQIEQVEQPEPLEESKFGATQTMEPEKLEIIEEDLKSLLEKRRAGLQELEGANLNSTGNSTEEDEAKDKIGLPFYMDKEDDFQEGEAHDLQMLVL